jgi:beta-phosphoglucomutase
LIRACIFDLDGVLVDTARYHYLAWKRLAAEFGYELTEENNERLKGVSRMRSLDIILELSGHSFSEAEKEKMADRKNGWFTEYLSKMNADEILPGVNDLLQQLKKDNIKIALASSSKNAQRIIEVLGIQDYFETVVDGNMVVNAKPAPDIFLLAAKNISITPQDCIVFEDAEAGVQAALRAGMKCVGVGRQAQLGQATIVVPSLKEFDYSQLKSL